MNHFEHRHNIFPVRVFPFLLVVGSGCPCDRNHGPGHVPGSPWNLSIRSTQSPPPPTNLQFLTSLHPFFSPCLEYHYPFAYPLASSILYRVSSPFLPPLHKYLFNFFTNSPFSSFYFYLLFLLYFFCFLSFSSYRSTDLISHIFQRFFFYMPKIFLLVGLQKITEILRSPLSILIQAFVLAATPRENPAFFNEIPCRERRWNVRLCRWQTSALFRTFFGGLMITEKLLDHAKVFPFFPFLFRRRFFNLCIGKKLRWDCRRLTRTTTSWFHFLNDIKIISR